jgi:hypothetical protein
MYRAKEGPFEQKPVAAALDYLDSSTASFVTISVIGAGSVLQRVKPEDVKLFPYPHIVLKDALPKHIYDHLAAHYPDERTLFSISRAMSPAKFTPKVHFRCPGPIMMNTPCGVG